MSIEQLRHKIKEKDLGAFLISSDESRRYISGFTGTAGYVLVTPTEKFLIVDSRYYELAERDAPYWEMVKLGQRPIEVMNQLFERLNLVDEAVRVGFEGKKVTVSEFEKWRKDFEGVNFQATSNVISKLRSIKKPHEVAKLRQAVAISDEAMRHIYEWIKPGMTEKSVAWELERHMRERGADAMAFPVMVAAGENSSLPHSKPTDRSLREGDVILIDMGCVVDGYHSDITRTFSLGDPLHDDYWEIWDLVAKANQNASKHIRAGMPAKEGDALARKVINEAGFEENFGHSLGHGIGLNVHEYPSVSPLNEYPLEVGMVTTIEPGIYLPNQFGVRLEDMVLIHENGTEILTNVPKIAVLG